MNINCSRCGKPTSSFINGICVSCYNRENLPQGWECPKCGFCYSPYVSECSNCNRITVTYSSNKTELIEKSS